MKRIFTVLTLLLCIFTAYASESFGKAVESSRKRFRVNTTKTVNIRMSPSKSGQRVTVAHDGDYIYGNDPEIVVGDGVKWLKFYQEGEGYRYIAYSYLSEEVNPYYVEPIIETPKESVSFEWLPIVFLILFAIVSVFSIFYFGRKAFLKYGWSGDQWYDVFLLGLKRDNGMKRMWVFNPNPYLSFSGLSGTIVGSFLATFLIILVIALITLVFFYIVGGLLWVLIILGWILVVGGALVLFIGKSGYGLIGLLGIPVIAYQDDLSDAASNMFDKGVELFNSMNPIELCIGIVLSYWKIALYIAITPLVVFLAIALIWLLIAGMVSLYESIVMSRYNVKHPCPSCGRPSEPAQYVIGRNSDGSPMVLPVHLRPGVYGIFHLRAPYSGQKLPTLFLNGKDKLERICPHCQTSIKADVGQEKHIAVAGVAQSGKTTLLYRIIAELERNYGASITDNMGVNHATIDRFLSRIKDGAEMAEYPPKTSESRHRSIQMMLQHKGAAIPYKLYLNDLAGEMFTADSNKAEDAPFFKNTNVILFIIDPMTMRSSDLQFGDDFSDWYKNNVGQQSDNSGKIDVEMALDVLKNTIEKHRKNKADIKNIPLMVLLTKADTGYLDNIDAHSSESIRTFLQNEMGLDKFVYMASTSFRDITYYAVSAKSKVEEEISGVDTVIHDLFEKLKIEWKD